MIRLRVTAPDLARPVQRPVQRPRARRRVPLPSVVGCVADVAVWVVGDGHAPGRALRRARSGSPPGSSSTASSGATAATGCSSTSCSPDEQVELAGAARCHEHPRADEARPIGEEMLATAVKLAQERGRRVEALHVISVPLDLPLDAPLADEEERAAAESLEEARALGEDHGVEVDGETVRARAIGEAIVDEAPARDVDLIVLGSAPRWRRQSRFFSPTVDYVLRQAPCEVLVVAFPQGVLEDERTSADCRCALS